MCNIASLQSRMKTIRNGSSTRPLYDKTAVLFISDVFHLRQVKFSEISHQLSGHKDVWMDGPSEAACRSAKCMRCDIFLSERDSAEHIGSPRTNGPCSVRALFIRQGMNNFRTFLMQHYGFPCRFIYFVMGVAFCGENGFQLFGREMKNTINTETLSCSFKDRCKGLLDPQLFYWFLFRPKIPPNESKVHFVFWIQF